MRRTTVRAFILVLGLAPCAFAQLSTGDIHGTIVDQSGGALPGVSVTLSGELGTRSTTTGDLGRYRLLRVDHGVHTLTTALPGFASVTREITVTIGADIDVDFTMRVATIEETITVDAETPIVSSKKLGTDIAVKKDELSRIPTAREPWALMRSVPGLLVDRVNLAGNKTGGQSGFFGKGTSDKDHTWTLDGLVITDEVSWSSPTYWNYDSFDEVNFVTGGQDISVASGGIGINVVTKRGTNSFHGGLSGFFTHDDLQGSNLPDELVGDPRLQGNDKADHTEQITDWSVNLGGPILEDKLWFWGVYGRNDIRIRTLNQTQDKTILKNMSAKLNWQAGPNDRISLMWFNSDKQKSGRRDGVLEQSASQLYDQHGTKRDGWINGLGKIEWDHVFSADFVLNAKYAYFNTGFLLTPRGGLDQREYNDFVNGLAWGSNGEQTFLRPQWTGNIDGHYFKGSHDIRFGAGYRRTAHDDIGEQPGDRVLVRFMASGGQAQFFRDRNRANRVERYSAYAGDTFTTGRLTVNAAVRWDRYTAFSLATSCMANEARPDLLPALNYPGSDGNVVTWNNVVPRVGVTYALAEDRRTVLRASASVYSGTLPATTASWDNPVGTSWLRYPWLDANGDRDVQMSEVDFDNLLRAYNVDPHNPTEVGSTPNEYDPDYGANVDYEAILGIEHELIPNLALSAAYTFRRATNLGYQGHSWWYPWLDDSGNLFTAADFTPSTQTLGGYDLTTYHPTGDAWGRVTWGWLMTNTPGYSQTFNGLELGLVKRLSNGWMGRFAFSYNKHTQSVGPEGIVDPTRTPVDTLDDGGDVGPWSAGTIVNARWQINANGMYELPAGFEVSANLFARQGYAQPDFAFLPHGFIGDFPVLPDGVGVTERRLPNVWNLDVRAAWRLRVGRANLTVSSEVFNAFNANPVMRQWLDLSSTAYGRIDEILAPRIMRLGVRVTF